MLNPFGVSIDLADNVGNAIHVQWGFALPIHLNAAGQWLPPADEPASVERQ